jgi:hypothetical protein
MKKVILLFILIIAAMVGVNAQDSAKQDSIVQDSIEMVKSLEAYTIFQVQRTTYLTSDSFLIERYKASVGTFIHRQKVKLPKPYQYEEDNTIIIEDMYKQKDEIKPYPTSNDSFKKWIEAQKKIYLKE